MNKALACLLSRRSTKKFTDQPVADKLLDQVLQAGLYAPTGRNNQNVICVAVRDPAVREQLSRMNREILGTDIDPFYGAPCVIVAFADSTGSTWVETVVIHFNGSGYDAGVNGEVGEDAVTYSVDENVDMEGIEIDLTEELPFTVEEYNVTTE